jgi:D-sedoheptulose 7-phosphate isomerase
MSAADAQHIAVELAGRFFRDRKLLRALAVHGNTSALAAIGNDFGYEYIFAREFSAHAGPGDILLAISTSGNNLDILRTIGGPEK